MPGNRLVRYSERCEFLSLDALSAEANLRPEIVMQFVQYGLLEPARSQDDLDQFDAQCVDRLQTIWRLRNDLGINLPGIAAILDLLARIKKLEREVADLRQSTRPI
jgi:DNA-binding transcriptional MerR regulator